MNEQDIRSMGGVWKKIPYTYAIDDNRNVLALTGFPFLSGYYSKDAIIEFTYLKGSTVGYLCSSSRHFYCLINSNILMEVSI